MDREYLSSKCILWFKQLETISAQSLGSPTEENDEREDSYARYMAQILRSYLFRGTFMLSIKPIELAIV